MTTKSKNLDYYMGLDYDLVVRKIRTDYGESYHVFTHELDQVAFYGVGETIEEAIGSFNETKEEMFETFLNEGIEIPEPNDEDEILPSGKFVVRTTPFIHKRLINLAKQEKQSLNSFINTLFNRFCTMESIMSEVLRRIPLLPSGMQQIVGTKGVYTVESCPVYHFPTSQKKVKAGKAA